MADRTGWSLEYVRGLSNFDFMSMIAMYSLEAEQAELAAKQAQRRR